MTSTIETITRALVATERVGNVTERATDIALAMEAAERVPLTDAERLASLENALRNDRERWLVEIRRAAAEEMRERAARKIETMEWDRDAYPIGLRSYVASAIRDMPIEE